MGMECQLLAMGRARLKLGHLHRQPSVHRHHLMHGRAVLVTPMRGLVENASLNAGVPEHVAERLFRQRLPTLTADESKIAAQSRRDSSRKLRIDPS